MNHFETPRGRAGASLRRLIQSSLAASAAAATLWACLPADVSAQAASSRFKPQSRPAGFVAHRGPLSLSTDKVRVALLLDGESVAEAKARAPQHLISDAEHQAIHNRLRDQQSDVESAVLSRGGRVLAHFQDAMNGLKVEVRRDQVKDLADIAGVVRVVPVRQYSISNTISVPFIGAPQVWQGTPGLRGEHIKVAVIDTGIDYTHADFGGPGTAAAFAQAAATSTQKADPSLFGPKAPKVKGGTDLAGDDYDASNADSVPVPDPNPLDCAGHGSHVSGTLAGFGVSADGSTYQGPYDAAAYNRGFLIGPGVAPRADLYAVRIFGCTGTSDLVDQGIDWAVDHDVDVISMSLGSPYGTADSSDAVAAANATKAGIVVVAAAGNDGPNAYLASSPSSGVGVISAAAIDARPTLPNGVKITLKSGYSAFGIDEDALPLPKGTVPALILKSGGALSLGCNTTDYPKSGAKGALVIVSRGTCSFDTKIQNAEAAGAVALAVVDNTAENFFSPLLTNPTIPFIAVNQTAATALAAQASPTTGMVASASVPDTGYLQAASFSSGGPRTGDGDLKPDVSAPGVNIFSVKSGSGTAGTFESGTSMATPHVAGVAALAIQAHPNWREPDWHAALTQTANPGTTTDYTPRIEGAGVVQAVGATTTDVTLRGTEFPTLGLLSFGVAELTADFHESREILLTNHGRFADSFAVSAKAVDGVPHKVTLSGSSVVVRGQSEAPLRVTLSVPGATVGATHDDNGNDRMAEVAGYLKLTPEGSSNHGVPLTVPYYLVPRARSNIAASYEGGKKPAIQLTNRNGLITGTGDFYAWGLTNKKTGAIDPTFEPRAIGVQSDPISSSDALLVFAVNTYGRFSNPAAGEYDIYIDIDGDGKYDYVVFTADQGLVTTGMNPNGVAATFLYDLSLGTITPEFITDAPTDGSTLLIPIFASDIGVTPDTPRFSYAAIAFDADGNSESVAGSASFNAFSPAVSTGILATIPPNKHIAVPVSVNAAEQKLTPALGYMVVTMDNLSGAPQASLIPLSH